MSKIDFQIKGIGTLIKEHHFVVPNYQRAYKWEEDNISALIKDLGDAIEKNENEYFLGTVVLSLKEGSKEIEIVDGQQRITTITILLSCIRDYFKNNKKEPSAASIQNDYISSYDTRNERNLSKLKLSIQDKSFFEKYIVDNETNELPFKSSHNRIMNAKKLLAKKINSIAGVSETQLHNWKDFITDKLMVVSIIVPSESNAFTLFETLNDRGLILAQTDLLKNYLFSRASDYLDEVQNAWMEMTAKIESELGEENILTYLKHFWSSRNGLTREKNKELYRSIVNSIKSPSDVRDFINELNEDSTLYLAIHNHKDNYWKENTEKSKRYIETLNYLELDQYRPLILSILKRFEKKKDIELSLKLIVTWVVRNLITGSLGGGALELEYASLAKSVYLKKITTASELRGNLKNIPSDEVFKNKLMNITISKDKLARYYLRAIESQYKGEGNAEFVVNDDPNIVDLEHILPKKPNKTEWKNFTLQEIEDYKKRLGNLTIMSKLKNSKLKSESFEKKKKAYSESEISITKLIPEKFNEWNPKSIETRQEFLSEIAVKTWNLKLE